MNFGDLLNVFYSRLTSSTKTGLSTQNLRRFHNSKTPNKNLPIPSRLKHKEGDNSNPGRPNEPRTWEELNKEQPL